ncbi:MAG: serine/threonine-protein kinase, partial [Acidobacteriota bacterium]
MTPERWHQIEELYQGALDLAANERPAYLERACGHDTALRQEIDSLLATHDEAPSFLETPLIAWPPDEPLMPPETHVGPYKLLRPLGRGGMGQVYLATRAGEVFRQYVALKVIRRGLDTEDILRRFRAEQQILATLHHANIAHLIDGGVTDDGQSYLVMEYVEGTPITTYCDGRQMTLEERVLLFRQVCEAVHHAHRNLVVHRDLKPSNILVTVEGVPKLLDFGIAKLLDPVASGMSVPTTQADGRVMTPEYASPEQVRGETITTASDVYALGVLLYELLVGRRPYHFERRTPQEIERVICKQEPEPPSAVLEKAVDGQPTDGTPPPMKPDEISTARGMTVERLRRRLNGDLDTIVLKALRKEPERRYASAQQLAEDLGRYLAGLPVLARPDTATYRAQKFVRRHRVGVAMTLIVVSLLLSFSVVSAVQSAEIRAKAEDVAQERDRAEEVIEFLVALFETPDPKVSKGNTVTARELLETGAARVEADLKEQPEVQADMMTVMSRVYRSLGLYDPAE